MYSISIIILIGHDGRVVKGAVHRVKIFQVEVTIASSNPALIFIFWYPLLAPIFFPKEFIYQISTSFSIGIDGRVV